MKILILGNSNIFRRKVYFALKKLKVAIEVASRRNIDKNFKIKKSYTSYEKALNDTKAKIVYISLINSEHFNWAVKALNKKKHVIIDKPITLNFNHTKKLSKIVFDNFKPMIPNDFHDLWKKGIDSESYFLKLCGSGGGGYILGFAPDIDKAKDDLKNYNLEVVYHF